MEAGDASAGWSLHHCNSLRQLTLSKSLVSSWERSMSGKSVSKRSEHTSSSPYWRRKKRERERGKGHVSQTLRWKQNSQTVCLFWDATKVHESLCKTWTQKTGGADHNWNNPCGETNKFACVTRVCLYHCDHKGNYVCSALWNIRYQTREIILFPRWDCQGWGFLWSSTLSSALPLLELGVWFPLGHPFYNMYAVEVLWGTLDKSLHHLAYTVYYYTAHCWSHKELSSTAPHLWTATHYR